MSSANSPIVVANVLLVPFIHVFRAFEEFLNVSSSTLGFTMSLGPSKSQADSDNVVMAQKAMFLIILCVFMYLFRKCLFLFIFLSRCQKVTVTEPMKLRGVE